MTSGVNVVLTVVIVTALLVYSREVRSAESRDAAMLFTNYDSALEELAKQLGETLPKGSRLVVAKPRSRSTVEISDQFLSYVSREVMAHLAKIKRVVVLEGDEGKIARLRDMQAQNRDPSFRKMLQDDWPGMTPSNLLVDGDVYVIDSIVDMSMVMNRLSGEFIGRGRVKISRSAFPSDWIPPAEVPHGATGTGGATSQVPEHGDATPPPSGFAGSGGNTAQTSAPNGLGYSRPPTAMVYQQQPPGSFIVAPLPPTRVYVQPAPQQVYVQPSSTAIWRTPVSVRRDYPQYNPQPPRTVPQRPVSPAYRPVPQQQPASVRQSAPPRTIQQPPRQRPPWQQTPNH